MSHLFRVGLAAFFILTTATSAVAADPAADDAYPKGEWVSLFNGKDLTGWTPKIRYCDLGDNFGNTFRVEDGLMKGALRRWWLRHVRRTIRTLVLHGQFLELSLSSGISLCK